MSQITLCLDEITTKLMQEQAQAAGVSESLWVANLIRERAAAKWPAAVLESFGAFPEMPTAELLRAGDVPDLAPESWR